MTTALRPDAWIHAEPALDSLENAAAALISDCEAKTERVGRILHDHVGQVLVGVGMHLDALRQDLQDRPDLAERTTELQQLLEQAMAQVRSLSTELNPSLVERAGLQYALEQLAVRHRAEYGTPARVQFDSEIRVPREIAIAFYRVAEYASRHAVQNADDCGIEIHAKLARGSVILEVRSKGKNSDATREKASTARVDLLKLRYHAARVGIGLNMETTPEKGTIVRTIYREVPESLNSAGAAVGPYAGAKPQGGE